MIGLHVLKLLADNDLGTIDTDLFWESMPLDKDGVTIFSRGGTITKFGSRRQQMVDFYSRHQWDTYAADKLEKIHELFIEEYATCTLPAVPGYSTKVYENTSILPLGNVENLGKDEENKTVFRMSATIIYNKQ